MILSWGRAVKINSAPFVLPPSKTRQAPSSPRTTTHAPVPGSVIPLNLGSSSGSSSGSGSGSGFGSGSGTPGSSSVSVSGVGESVSVSVSEKVLSSGDSSNPSVVPSVNSVNPVQGP